MTSIKAGRLRDAREFLGFTVADIAGALGCEPAELERIEAGEVTITVGQLRRLSRIYRRPVAWFSGESRFEPDAGLLRQVENLCEHDRDVVLEFAEWLQGAGPAPARPRAALPGEDGTDGG